MLIKAIKKNKVREIRSAVAWQREQFAIEICEKIIVE